MNRLAAAAAAMLMLAGAAAAAPLSPNQGAVAITGALEDGAGNRGEYQVQAVLKEGYFTGTGRISIAGQVLEAPLHARRSYYENGRCVFYWERDRARAELYGPCDSAGHGVPDKGGFDAFLPGQGVLVGKASGKVVLSGGVRAPPAPALPVARLSCAYQERTVSFRAGETMQFGAIVSQGALTLRPGGVYVAGSSNTPGRYARTGDKVRFTSGPWAGAVATLEPDSAGKPALTFDREENAAAGRVLPQTTRCVQPN
jgi:hypothetical protein